MRLESLIIGVVVLGFGIVLVATNGVVFGVNLPGIIGLPSCTSSSGGQNTTSLSFGCGFVAPGTIVCLFGLGLVANGLRSPGRSARGIGGASAPVDPSALMAQMMAAQQNAARSSPAPGPAAGVRYCANCGRSNASDAGFCQGCGQAMPPRTAPSPALTTPPPPPPGAPPPA